MARLPLPRTWQEHEERQRAARDAERRAMLQALADEGLSMSAAAKRLQVNYRVFQKAAAHLGVAFQTGLVGVPKGLQHLTEAQRAAYRQHRAYGCTRAEALAAVEKSGVT